MAGAALASSVDIASNGLLLRLRADQGITMTGSGITTWADISGNSNNYTANTVWGAAPTYSADGFGTQNRASVDLLTGNDILMGPSLGLDCSTGVARTVFVVMQQTGTSTTGAVFGKNGSNPYGFYVEMNSSGYPYLETFGAGNVAGSATAPTDILAVCAAYDGATTNSLAWIVGNGAVGSNSATASWAGTNTWKTQIGNTSVKNSTSFVGKIAEIVVYDRALTTEELAQNVGYYKSYYLGVPEPGTFALLGMGLFGLLAYAWRKRK